MVYGGVPRDIKEHALAQIENLLAGDLKPAQRSMLDKAAGQIAKSLDQAFWADGFHLERSSGTQVFGYEAAAAESLLRSHCRGAIGHQQPIDGRSAACPHGHRGRRGWARQFHEDRSRPEKPAAGRPLPMTPGGRSRPSTPTAMPGSTRSQPAENSRGSRVTREIGMRNGGPSGPPFVALSHVPDL